MKKVNKVIILTILIGLIIPFYFYLGQAASIPASYDLRKSNPGKLAAHGNITITPKDQGWWNSNYNLCWAFASLNALETHIQVKSNGKTNPVLSVRHLDYLTSNSYSSKGAWGRTTGNAGGVNLSLRYFMNNDGPVLNSKSNLTKYPVWNSSGTVTGGTDYVGKSLTASQIKTLDGYTPLYYVHKVISFSPIVKENGKAKSVPIDSSYAYDYSKGTSVSDAQLKANRDKIKQHIMENGGVTCLTTPSARVIVNGISYNYTAKNGGGHMVTIVGWDDNLDIKAKTNGKLNPPGKGAYLILNSYGKHYGGTSKNDGFEWISYYDSVVEYCNFGYLEVDKTQKQVTATFSNSTLYKKIKTKLYSEIKNSSVGQSAYKSLDSKYYPVTATDSENKLKMLDLVANTYSITVLNIESSKVTSNDIKELAKVAPNLENVRLDGNSLQDVSALASFKNLTKVKLNNNKIEDVSSINNIIKQSSTFQIQNQSISKTIKNTDECAYPNLFTKAKNKDSKLYSSSGFEFVNCKENSSKTGVIVTDVTKDATVKIKAGNAKGSVMTIKVTGTVDKTGPVLSTLNVTSPSTGSYGAGQEIKIVATFNENVYGNASKTTITASTAPTLKIKFGTGTERTATFSAVSGKTITYTYKAVSTDEGKLQSTGYSGTVYDEKGNKTTVSNKALGGNSITILKPTVSPDVPIRITLSTLGVTSPASGNYGTGQEIKIVATYTGAVYGNASKATVTAATAPTLKIKFGTGAERTATFLSSSANIITYTYTIVSTDVGKLQSTSYSGTVYSSTGEATTISNKTLGGNSITADQNITPENPTTLKKGDINGDENINISDVLKLRRYIANQTRTKPKTEWNLTEEQLARADVNGDGNININDVLKLRRYIAASNNATIKTKHPDWIW